MVATAVVAAAVASMPKTKFGPAAVVGCGKPWPLPPPVAAAAGAVVAAVGVAVAAGVVSSFPSIALLALRPIDQGSKFYPNRIQTIANASPVADG